MNKVRIENVAKGDTLNLECDLDKDITNWKIRAEVFDNHGNCIKLGNSLVTNGSDSQIEITDASNGIFIIHVEKGKTECFSDKGFIEIEVENTETPTEKFTILRGKDSTIDFVEPEIDWVDVS